MQCGVLLALMGGAAPATADITAPHVLAGPSADIAEFGNVALAADGTGGAIWRAVTDEGSHIFVARYGAGEWQPAQRVDVSLPYSSYHPRLAAAPGGHLVAVWVQDYAHRNREILYRLSSSVLRPGSKRFEPPFTVDSKIGAGQAALDAVSIDFRLNDAGVGYLAYRVRSSQDPAAATPNRPGDMLASFRVARYNRGSWSSVGSANRNPAYTVPAATAGNGPKVSVDVLGNGVVAFLEPDADGVLRVWGRRLFGARLGLVTPVGPTSVAGTPLNGNADAFALAGGALGAAAVAVRQQPGRPSPLAGPRLFVAQLLNGEQTGAQRFQPPLQIDDATGRYGLPSIAMDARQNTMLAFGTPGAALQAPITRDGPAPPTAVAGADVIGDPQVTVGPFGAGVMAYPSARGGTQGVEVMQSIARGGSVRARLAGPMDGELRDLSLAGSGLGDALIGFRQGVGDASRLVVSAVQAAPQSFLVNAPGDWVRPDGALVTWDRAASGVGGLVYDVSLGGRMVAAGLAHPAFQLPRHELVEGANRVVVRARDASGQTALGGRAIVNVDATPPRPTVVVSSKRRIMVRVSDALSGTRAQGAGVDPESVFISFGDGAKSSDTVPAKHRYRRPGRYYVRVRAADALGNQSTTTIRVRIR